MADTLLVLLEDGIAGAITRLGDGRLRFDYDEEYQGSASATPLSIAMPTSMRSHSDGVIGPWLWGLLPDNEAVVRRWARDFHVSASPFSLLSTSIGRDCPGAVRFATPDALDSASPALKRRPRAAEEAVLRFFDALVWNWLIAGTDAHAKNYSLLLAGQQVQLAPLYDIASALPYGVHERKLRLAMKIGGDCRVHMIHNMWPRAARELGLDADVALDRARELAGQAPRAFSEAAGAPAVVELESALPSRLVELGAERAERCLALVDAPGG